VLSAGFFTCKRDDALSAMAGDAASLEASGKGIKVELADGEMRCVAMAKDGATVVVGSSSGAVHLYSLAKINAGDKVHTECLGQAPQHYHFILMQSYISKRNPLYRNKH
jgi:hypothetical protein